MIGVSQPGEPRRRAAPGRVPRRLPGVAHSGRPSHASAVAGRPFPAPVAGAGLRKLAVVPMLRFLDHDDTAQHAPLALLAPCIIIMSPVTIKQ